MKMYRLLVGIIVSLILNHAYVQAQDLETDRPDQSTTPVLIPKGALQIETGFMVEKDTKGSLDLINYAYNSTLIKFGVNENFEARLALGYLGVKQMSDQIAVRKGFAPVAFGIKIKLADQHNLWPQASLISNVTLKTGAEEFQPRYTHTDVTLALMRSFGSRLSLTFNGGVKWNGSSPEAEWLYILSLGYNINDKLAVFIEAYGFFPESQESDHLADAGITYKLSPRIQIDASGGSTISKTPEKIFISSGLSIRLFK